MHYFTLYPEVTSLRRATLTGKQYYLKCLPYLSMNSLTLTGHKYTTCYTNKVKHLKLQSSKGQDGTILIWQHRLKTLKFHPTSTSKYSKKSNRMTSISKYFKSRIFVSIINRHGCLVVQRVFIVLKFDENKACWLPKCPNMAQMHDLMPKC